MIIFKKMHSLKPYGETPYVESKQFPSFKICDLQGGARECTTLTYMHND